VPTPAAGQAQPSRSWPRCPASLAQSSQPAATAGNPVRPDHQQPEIVRLVAEPWPANVDGRGVIQQMYDTSQPAIGSKHLRPDPAAQVASSSRSQLAMRTARAAVSLTWEAWSVDVHWCPSLTGIVTHLVTRSYCTPGAVPTISLGLACHALVDLHVAGQASSPVVHECPWDTAPGSPIGHATGTPLMKGTPHC
jgi:hypothetical protein